MSFPIYDGTSPLVSDRFIMTFIAGEDLLTPGTLVELTSAFTVKRPTAANSLKVVGLTLTAAKSGSKVSVVCRGFCRATAYGNIAAGDQIGNASGSTSAYGKIISDNTSKNTTIIGMALQAISSGATGLVLLW
jgi:hypothetical protein